MGIASNSSVSVLVSDSVAPTPTQDPDPYLVPALVYSPAIFTPTLDPVLLTTVVVLMALLDDPPPSEPIDFIPASRPPILTLMTSLGHNMGPVGRVRADTCVLEASFVKKNKMTES